MRLLFATSGAAHTAPLIPFAHAARRAGHQVLMAGEDAVAPLAAEAGLRFWPVAGQSARAALPGMATAIREWYPDVVVRDSGEFASLVAAERFGIPSAQLELALAAEMLDRPALHDLRAAAGVRFASRARELRLTLAPASLDVPATSRAVHRFRDPASAWAPPLWGTWGDSQAPLLVLGFDGESYPALHREALAALVALPLRVLVITGGGAPASLGTLPPAVRAERWVPQAAALRDAAVMVSHGDAGSTLAALAAGVPTAFVDRSFNARRVAELGAGIALDDVAGLGEAVLRLLGEPSFAARARQVRDEIQALPPVDTAIELLAQLADARQAA
ncbi:MAG TPA: glycosyltransferase [Solirubrobacter sp.]|nr:glycosyltransferase [Solirubrobacter sp.]